MGKKPKSYYKKKHKEWYEKDKKLRKMYHDENVFGETYSHFKKRMSRVKKPFN